ncbi:MAG TPA: HIT domain-containing protein [Candidatus Limnocylindria bacterium]|nr:HIT domain-containing protein [Candidatus Limnocylindria bacterium]
MSDCVICRIVAGEIPAKIVHQDDRSVAFRDIDPQAPLHVLVVPRAHVAALADLDDAALGGHLLGVARTVAADAGYRDSFRLVVNNGEAAGQSVRHLHLHVLGGRRFAWPPG